MGGNSSKYIHTYTFCLFVASPCLRDQRCRAPPALLGNAPPDPAHSHHMECTYTKRLGHAEVTLTRTDATYIQMCDQYRQALLGNGIAALWLTTSCDFFFAFVTRRNADGRDDRIIRRRLIGWRPTRVGSALRKRRSSLTYPRKETAFLQRKLMRALRMYLLMIFLIFRIGIR